MSRMSRFTARRIVTALVVPAVAGAGLLTASSAMAAPMPGPISAAVVVPQTLTLTFTSGTSFSLAPGATQTGAVAFTVSSNDGNGYTVAQSAPDLSNGSAFIPATDLSYALNFTDAAHPGGGSPGPAAALTNTSATFVSPVGASLPAGDTYTQDWTAATVPANQAPGSYQTDILYTAIAK